MIEFGLYRLLVAFVLDALVSLDRRPEDHNDLRDRLRAGRLDPNLLTKYVDLCGDVFDLFHPDRPFLQVPLASEPKPLAGLYPVSPSGTNANHWCHLDEEQFELTAAESARLLTTIAPFMTAGGRSWSPSINGAPAIYTLPLGKNLFQTLVLNLPTRFISSADGTVAWRSRRTPGEERTQASILEALTWRPRKVQFIPESRGGAGIVVRSMRFEPGDSARLKTWRDSNLAYKLEGKPDEPEPIRMQEGRPLWRDAGPLFLLRTETAGSGEGKIAFQRPDVVHNAFSAVGEAESLPIKAYGMRTDGKMKVFEWADTVWKVPTKLDRTRLGALVHNEIELADRAALALRRALTTLYPREGKGNGSALGTMVNRCERSYWLHLEQEFGPLMSRFAALPDDAPDTPDLVSNARKPWRTSIKKQIEDLFETAAQGMDSDSDALERQVRASTRLMKKLRKLLA
jgi:CRISPR system Cascade subunit CasA